MKFLENNQFRLHFQKAAERGVVHWLLKWLGQHLSASQPELLEELLYFVYLHSFSPLQIRVPGVFQLSRLGIWG